MKTVEDIIAEAFEEPISDAMATAEGTACGDPQGWWTIERDGVKVKVRVDFKYIERHYVIFQMFRGTGLKTARLALHHDDNETDIEREVHKAIDAVFDIVAKQPGHADDWRTREAVEGRR